MKRALNASESRASVRRRSPGGPERRPGAVGPLVSGAARSMRRTSGRRGLETPPARARERARRGRRAGEPRGGARGGRRRARRRRRGRRSAAQCGGDFGLGKGPAAAGETVSRGARARRGSGRAEGCGGSSASVAGPSAPEPALRRHPYVAVGGLFRTRARGAVEEGGGARSLRPVAERLADAMQQNTVQSFVYWLPRLGREGDFSEILRGRTMTPLPTVRRLRKPPLLR